MALINIHDPSDGFDLQFHSDKNKNRKSKCSFGFYGPSDWIRTSGLLNPIQARYQTSPHPDLLSFSLPLNDCDILTRIHQNVKPFFQHFSTKVRRPEKGLRTRDFR